MFGLGKRDERAVDAVREEMSAADTRARAVLANAMAQIESRLSNDHEETARLQASTQAAIENLRYEVASRPADIGPVLEQVAAMCALVAERLEADRLERRALTEAITLLARPGLADGPSRVLGGTVMASSEISIVDDPIHRDPIPAPDPSALDHTIEHTIEHTIDHTIEPIETVAMSPVDVPSVRPSVIDLVPAPVAAPAHIDLTAEERAESTSTSGTEIWNVFEKGRIDPVATPADPATESPAGLPVEIEEQLDLRPRQGTRLTAARRSNAGASYR